MSFANQPSRLLISSDDLSYGVGNSFTCTLPEPITGAVKADLLRAVVPNTAYQIPAYQSTFYYYISTAGGGTTLQSFSIDVNQYFDGLINNPTYGLTSFFPLLDYLNLAGTQTALVFSYNYNKQRVVITAAGGVATVAVAPSTAWSVNVGSRSFALNTRLGFIDSDATALGAVVSASILANLIRSKVVYVLCNVVMNDSITTDGLRTAIAKIPVNSTFGGLTLYQPPYLNWNRLITQGSYQQVTISLLDDQYQPYPLNVSEFCEFEICFRYDDFENARGPQMF